MLNAQNINQASFEQLVEALSEVYKKEIPEFAIDRTFHLNQLAEDIIYFSNQYAFIAELWAITTFRVRELRRTRAPADDVADAIARRDYLDKVMSATKLKYHAVSRLLQFYQQPEYKHGL